MLEYSCALTPYTTNNNHSELFVHIADTLGVSQVYEQKQEKQMIIQMLFTLIVAQIIFQRYQWNIWPIKLVT